MGCKLYPLEGFLIKAAEPSSKTTILGWIVTPKHNVGVVTGVGYSGYGYGKREADAYTIGQVAHGLPLANAYATGHPHNVGVVTGVGYGGHGVYYGKREAEAYTIGQVAYGGARGVVTGVDYGYGRVAGYGAVGN